MRRAALLMLATGLVGCATLGGGAGPEAAAPPRTQADDRVSEARLSELQRQAAMAEAELKLLRRQLAALQVEVERLSAAEDARSVAARTPSAPPARADLVGPRIESSELDPVRAAPPPASPVAPEVVSVAPRSQEPVRSGPPAPLSTSGQEIYDQGYTLYHQGRYIDAESSFQRFLQANGNTELADNAQFWIGESRFAREDYMGALLAFQEVVDAYPEGNKVADALLKVGDCLVRLDNAASGRERYEEVLRRFPGSAAAAMAEERLGRSSG